VAKQSDAFGKFIRLNLTSEIVEVVSSNSSEITIDYKGRHLTLRHSEVSRLTPEETAAAAKRLSG
jgi:hypothetical protein